MVTKFNPDNKEELTISEVLGTALKITDPEDAEQYLRAYIKYIQDFMDGNPRQEVDFSGIVVTAEEIAKRNLAYYAGYFSHETRIRVERLFKCSHPFFGKASKGEQTADEAYKAGRKLMRKLLEIDKKPATSRWDLL